MTSSLFPLVTFDAISRGELNACLVAWGHKMGPCERATAGWSHGLQFEGELVAVVATDTLIRETCAGFGRSQAVELSRLCSCSPALTRVALRLWREFVFCRLCVSSGYRWAVSYQCEALHTGNTYRFDGWIPVGRSSSGTDPRGNRKGRRKTIWAWSPYPEDMTARRAA